MRTLFFFSLIILSTSFSKPNGFLPEQKKFARVRQSISEKGKFISEKLKQNGLLTSNINILFVACKSEETLEIYAKKKSTSTYKLLDTYRICAQSGNLGPKFKHGDNQVPEGFYHINCFNPTSNFYLSLGINYPNASDKARSNAANLGGDIFIHGSCVTIGCLPMTDDKIKEIYLYAVYAKNNGQNEIPVYIFPFKMTDQNMSKYSFKHANEPDLISFWNNIKTGYKIFENDKKELIFSIDKKGNFKF